MSAWLCSQDHINLLVAASNEATNGNMAFKMLTQENLRSLKERYPGRDFLHDWINDASTYKYEVADPEALVSRALKQALEFELRHRGDYNRHVTKRLRNAVRGVRDGTTGTAFDTERFERVHDRALLKENENARLTAAIRKRGRIRCIV